MHHNEPVAYGDNPEEIRREIARTRANLSHDVNALAYKASPTRVVEERKQRVAGALRGLRDTVMGTTPGPTRTLHDSMSTATDKAHDMLTATGDRTTEAMHAVGEAASELPTQVRRQTQGNPLAAGLIAFGAGWLVSSLLPATEPEKRAVAQAREAVGEHVDGVKEGMAAVAAEMRDELREPAAEAVQSVRSVAADAAQNVAHDTRAAARDVKEQTVSSGGGATAR
ncbi:MAG TPA: DUF3618 domain-containing protein [Pilimelia sp.]|nr:DUF3618 domain-containing protein [Pilimelia sp.]